ncbi:hypothetical protein ACET3Z_028675 [Daucus carota]
MESKNTASFALVLSLGLLCFSLVSATGPTPYIPGSRPSTYYSTGTCDGLKLGVCANVLNLVDVVVGSPPTLPCCSLIQGLVDLEAALCLCTAIKANILGINLNVPIALSLVLNNCGKKVPTVVTLTTHDSRHVLNLTFKASYSNAPTLRYFVIANAIASGYSIIVLFIPSKNSLWKFVLISDLIVTSMLVSSISAALGVAQIGKKGNSHAGWLPICDQVPKFCDRLTGALIAGFVAPILYLLLVLFSLHNLINLLSAKA